MSDPGGTARKALVILADGPRPDMVHLHERIAREMPEFTLHSLFLRSQSEFVWARDVPEVIHPHSLARGRDATSVERWWGSPWGDWHKGRDVLAHIDRHDTRAVVLNGYSDLTLIRTLLGCRARGIPVLERGDANARCEPLGTPLRRWLKRRLVPAFLRRCDAVLPFGRFGIEFYTRYGADPARCVLVPAIPDFAAFEEVAPEAVSAFQARHRLDPARRRLLFCGRMIPLKRIDLLLTAFAELAPVRPDWDLVLVGDGPEQPGLRASLPAALAERVHWLGELEWRELPAAYHACHVLALPSEIENWGVVVLEAMATGQAVVASDVVQAAFELCGDGVSGRIFRSGDPVALAAALRDITEDAAYAASRAAVPGALAAWRQRCDPVAGLREALGLVGAL